MYTFIFCYLCFLLLIYITFFYSRAANTFETVVSNDMMLKLKWSDTDNYYMNMGVDTGKLALVLNPLLPRRTNSSINELPGTKLLNETKHCLPEKDLA